MKKRLVFALAIVLCYGLTGCSKKTHNDSTGSKRQAVTNDILYTEIEWVDLLPEADLHALENPPDYLEDIEDGSAEDSLQSQLKTASSNSEDRYQQALVSQEIRPEFNGRHVRIPGFIVPLEFDDHQTIKTFFLVPFFGACIHMPPPPPNQIIYSEYEPGIRLEALYDPFWIDGTVSTTLMENDMATAAYSISVNKIEPYIEFPETRNKKSLSDEALIDEDIIDEVLINDPST